jgi:hypothetical protein
MNTCKPFVFRAQDRFDESSTVIFDYISPFLTRIVATEIFHPPLV